MKTLNTIQTYEEAGRKSGRAASLKDYALARFHQKWLSDALALELPEHREACRNAFNQAYRRETGFTQ